jgi:hypothetical protein
MERADLVLLHNLNKAAEGLTNNDRVDLILILISPKGEQFTFIYLKPIIRSITYFHSMLRRTDSKRPENVPRIITQFALFVFIDI